MSKFGDIIDAKIPILLNFYSDLDESSTEMHAVLRDVAAAMGDHGKVIKIDVEKNPKLSEALRVRGLPTLMIYKGGEMVWRQSGDQDANTIISLMKDLFSREKQTDQPFPHSCFAPFQQYLDLFRCA